MKSFFSSILVFIAAIFILPFVFSCKANISSEDDTCFVRISIDGEDSDSRTVLPKEIDIDTLSFSLKATQGGRTETSFWNSLAEMKSSTFEIDYGSWNFTLTAYSDGIAVLVDTKKNVSISVGANSLSFTLHAPDDGVGSFSMKIKVGKEFSAVQATLCDMTGKAITEEEMGSSYNPEKDGALTQNWTSEDFAAEDFDGTVTFSISANVPKGYYILSFAFTKGTGKNAVISRFKTVADIAPGNESSDSYDVTEGTPEEPNEEIVAFYSVKYEDGVDGSSIPVPEDATLYKAYNANEKDKNVKNIVTINFKDVGSRTGFTFYGWRRSNSVSYKCPENPDTAVTFEMPPNNVTLTAIWTPDNNIPYTVRHWKQKLNETQTVASGSNKTITEPENTEDSATCVDYELSSTDILSGTTETLTAVKTIDYEGFAAQNFTQKKIEADGSTIVDVFYNRKSYSVSYTDGVEAETIDVPETSSWCYGAKVTVAQAVARTGYTFDGWNLLGTETETVYDAGSTFDMPARNMTFAAKWLANTDTPYTVHHWKQKLNEEKTAASGTDKTIVNDGESLTCKDYDLSEADTDSLTGTTAALTSAVAKNYTGFTPQTIVQKNIAPDGSTIVDVFYNRNLYTVTYSDNVEDSTIAVPINSSWCYEAKVTVNFVNSNNDAMDKVGLRTGYTFLGWSENPLAVTATYTSESSASPVMGSSGITLYAVWSKNEAAITIVLDTENDMVPFTYEITGENKNNIKFTAPKGYTSYAWYVSNVSGCVGNESEYTWEMVSDGTYYITLLATDEAGKIWSSMMTMTIKVDKQ